MAKFFARVRAWYFGEGAERAQANREWKPVTYVPFDGAFSY